jgi:hypothetical protein
VTCYAATDYTQNLPYMGRNSMLPPDIRGLEAQAANQLPMARRDVQAMPARQAHNEKGQLHEQKLTPHQERCIFPVRKVETPPIMAELNGHTKLYLIS